MAFDWVEFLRLAQNLAANGDEASKRTAISRAYYFIFHTANARVIQNHGRRPQGFSGGNHAWCWETYENAEDDACRAVGLEGNRLKRLRHDADYGSADIRRVDDVCNRTLLEVQQLHADLGALNRLVP